MGRQITQEEAARRFKECGITMLEPYVNSHTKIILKWITCGHECAVHPMGIFNSGRTCPKCGIVSRTKKKILAEDEVARRFLIKGFELIGQYRNNKTKSLTRCIECLHEWNVKAENIFNGQGCPKCSGHWPVSKSEAVDRFARRGLDICDIRTYSHSHSRVSAICRDCAHIFEVVAYHIFNGGGCPECANHGFKTTKPAVLYYARVPLEDRSLYKIGVTNRTASQRFAKERHRIDILSVTHFSSGMEAYKEEQNILREHAQYLYSGPNVLYCGGNHELFTHDVLQLENTKGQMIINFPRAAAV